MQTKSLPGFLTKKNLMEVGRAGVLQRRSSNAACLVMMMVKIIIASVLPLLAFRGTDSYWFLGFSLQL